MAGAGVDKEMIHGLALCAGVGGLELGLQLVFGERYRTVGYVEREAYAAALLVARMEDKALDQAPIWDDLETFDGSPWRGKVDLITAGLPCQPFSVAGKREGDQDERYIWQDFFRIVSEIEPAMVFLENVPGILAWFRPIGEELSGLGYDFEVGLFTAAEVGAPHRRERFFCMGYRGLGILRESSGGAGLADGSHEAVGDAASPRYGFGRSGEGQALRNEARDREPHGRRDAVANSGCARSRRPAKPPGVYREGPPDDHRRTSRALADSGQRLVPQQGRGPQGREGAESAGEVLANANRAGRQQIARGAPSDEKTDGRTGWDVCKPLFPPAPNEQEAWAEILREHPELAPAVEPEVCRVDDGMASRLDRLRACGNGVVALQAAYAFAVLAGQINADLPKRF